MQTIAQTRATFAFVMTQLLDHVDYPCTMTARPRAGTYAHGRDRILNDAGRLLLLPGPPALPTPPIQRLRHRPRLLRRPQKRRSPQKSRAKVLPPRQPDAPGRRETARRALPPRVFHLRRRPRAVPDVRPRSPRLVPRSQRHRLGRIPQRDLLPLARVPLLPRGVPRPGR